MKKIYAFPLLCLCIVVLFFCGESFLLPLVSAKARFCLNSELPWPEEGRLVKEVLNEVGFDASRLFVIDVPNDSLKKWVKQVEKSNNIIWVWGRPQPSHYLFPENLTFEENLYCVYSTGSNTGVLLIVDEERGRLWLVSRID